MIKRTLFALMALLALIGVVSLFHYDVISLKTLAWALTVLPVFGTVTTSYLFPATTTPTFTQGSMVIATVASSAAGDNSAIITHAFGLSNAEISQGFPILTFDNQGDEQSGGWFEVSENPNFVVLGAGTSAAKPTTKVVIERPNTLVR